MSKAVKIQKVLLVDVDGVILNVYKHLTDELLEDTGIYIDYDKEIQSWNMTELDKVVTLVTSEGIRKVNPREYAFERFKEASFMRDLPYLPQSVESLKKICEKAEQNDIKVILYTACFTVECKAERGLWYKNLKKQAGLDNLGLYCVVGHNTKKKYNFPCTEVVGYIDDNPTNLRMFDDSIPRYMVKACHNRLAIEQNDVADLIVCDSLEDFAEHYLEDLLMRYKKVR